MKDNIINLKTTMRDLNERIKILERIIDEQRLRIKLLQIELNRKKKWWEIWK